ncbi:MAG: hypothetical protein ACRD93_03130 [Nitrososphaeraceae archaeon]
MSYRCHNKTIASTTSPTDSSISTASPLFVLDTSKLGANLKESWSNVPFYIIIFYTSGIKL